MDPNARMPRADIRLFVPYLWTALLTASAHASGRPDKSASFMAGRFHLQCKEKDEVVACILAGFSLQ